MLSDLNWMWWTNLFGKVVWDCGIGGVVMGKAIGGLGMMGVVVVKVGAWGFCGRILF